MERKKDECLYCNRRNCYERVVSSDDNGKTYDEVACIEHANDLYNHSDLVAPKVKKMFISSTSRLRRGDELLKGDIK